MDGEKQEHYTVVGSVVLSVKKMHFNINHTQLDIARLLDFCRKSFHMLQSSSLQGYNTLIHKKYYFSFSFLQLLHGDACDSAKT